MSRFRGLLEAVSSPEMMTRQQLWVSLSVAIWAVVAFVVEPKPWVSLIVIVAVVVLVLLILSLFFQRDRQTKPSVRSWSIALPVPYVAIGLVSATACLVMLPRRQFSYKLFATHGKYVREYLDERALLERALANLAIQEKALSPDHPNVVTSLNNLGLLYEANGSYREAEALFKRALAIQEKALGPDHPNVVTSLNNLGLLYEASGSYGEAEAFFKRALAIQEKALTRREEGTGWFSAPSIKQNQ